MIKSIERTQTDLIKRKGTNQITALNIEFQQILVEYQASPLYCYSFEFFDSSIEKIFGRLIGFKTHIIEVIYNPVYKTLNKQNWGVYRNFY